MSRGCPRQRSTSHRSYCPPRQTRRRRRPWCLSPPTPTPTSQAKRAAAALRSGQASRAARALYQNKLANAANPAIRDHAAVLHPAGPLPSAIPALPGHAPLVFLGDNEDTRKAAARLIKGRLANGSAPDLYGMTGEHVAVLLDDPECLQLFLEFATYVRNGRVQEPGRAYLVAAQLIFITKDTTVRPIGIPETVYRFCALTVAEDVGAAAAEHMFPLQCGVGVRGGSELVSQTLQALLYAPAPADEVDAPPDWRGEQLAGVAVDVTNAFNSVSRVSILSSLFAMPAYRTAWRFVHWAYRDHGVLVVLDGHGGVAFQMWSQQGVRQGDPVSPFLFSVAVQPVLIEVKNTTGAALFAILDDITIVTIARTVERAFVLLQQRLFDVCGLTVSLRKTKGLWLHSTPVPAELVAFEQHTHVQISITPLKVLGNPLGADRRAVKNSLLDIVDDHARFFARLLHPDLPMQCAFTLLRLCGLPGFNYVSRTALPQDAAEAAALFDQRVLEAFTQLVHQRDDPAALSESTRRLAQLPLRLGGLGLTSQADIGPLAWYGGLAQASYVLRGTARQRVEGNPLLAEGIRLVAARVDTICRVDGRFSDTRRRALPLPADDLSPASTLQHYGTADMPPARAHLRTSTAAPNRPAGRARARPRGDDDEQPDHPAERLQAALSRPLLEQRQRSLLRGLSVAHQVAVRHAGGTLASAWLLALPTDGATTLPDDHYRIALRTRARLPPLRSQPTYCFCGHRMEALDANNHHLGCLQLRASGHSFRHDLVKQALASVLRRAGAAVTVEKATGRGLRRFDLFMAAGARTIALDVTVVHSNTPGRLGAALGLARVGAAVAMAERNKCEGADGYVQEAVNAGAEFVAFAMDTYGHMGKQAKEFLNAIPAFATPGADARGLSPEELRELAKHAVAIALQKGNALAYIEGRYRSFQAFIEYRLRFQRDEAAAAARHGG